MRINNEPKGSAYYELLDLAFDTCSMFSLVVDDPKDPTLQKAMKIIEMLTPFLIECKIQCEWPGTMRMGNVFVYYYSCDNEANNVLKQVSNCIFDWVTPDLPNDLIFYKNGQPWLINTAHEFLCYIVPDDDEARKLININGLELTNEKY